MSHDAATGYVKPGSLSASGLTWRYSKNQVGSAYQQLSDGARALDLRPKLLSNGTVIFQHGDINIPVLFETVIADAVRWCADNPDELVILLPSDFAYQSTATRYDLDDDFYAQENKPIIVGAMESIYQQHGVSYLHCTEVYGLTIAEVMEIALLPTGGYLFAMDQQDWHGTPCAKPNWNEQSTVVYDDLMALKSYMLASSNGEPTDNRNTLGPPASTYNWPLNEIQAFWQVTEASAVSGVSRLSSILDDNKRSKLNEVLVGMLYEKEFNEVSIFACDNVALNGNALLSVMRTACGQSSELEACGQELSKPRMEYLHASKLVHVFLAALYIVVFLWISIALALAYRDGEDNPHPRLLWTAFQRLQERVPNAQTSKKDELLKAATAVESCNFPPPRPNSS